MSGEGEGVLTGFRGEGGDQEVGGGVPELVAVGNKIANGSE
jgi:hypothetical protein